MDVSTLIAASLALRGLGPDSTCKRMERQHPRITGRKRARGVRNRSPRVSKPYQLEGFARAVGWAWRGDGVQPEPTRQMVRANARRLARTAERDAGTVAVAEAIRAGQVAA